MNYDKFPPSVWVYVAPAFILSYDDDELKEKLELVEQQYKAQKTLILNEIERRKKQ